MLEPLDHDEDKDFTTEEFEDFDPYAESSLSITFANMGVEITKGLYLGLKLSSEIDEP